jgi:Nucleotide modification associated domain 1
VARGCSFVGNIVRALFGCARVVPQFYTDKSNRLTLLKDTSQQFDQVIAGCRILFGKKTKDYGTAWRILRTTSLTDQLFIKAQRIRTLEQNGFSKVEDGVADEFIGLINYSIMALIQLELGSNDDLDWDEAKAITKYDEQVKITKDLMMNKNHDYGEAWREMRVSSFTDLILMKLLRIKQIEDNRGQTLVSEGIDSGYRDIFNYSVFALIQLNEK